MFLTLFPLDPVEREPCMHTLGSCSSEVTEIKAGVCSLDTAVERLVLTTQVPLHLLLNHYF